jgi:hypothetical protein
MYICEYSAAEFMVGIPYAPPYIVGFAASRDGDGDEDGEGGGKMERWSLCFDRKR